MGYVMSSYGIYRTTDAGDTWTSVWDWLDFNPVTSIEFIDENVGWVTGVSATATWGCSRPPTVDNRLRTSAARP